MAGIFDSGIFDSGIFDVDAGGTTNATANATGTSATSTAASLSASGAGAAVTAGFEAASAAGTVAASATASPVAVVSGAEATATAGQVTANSGKSHAQPGVRVVDYAPRFVTRINGRARVLPVDALITAGPVFASGQSNVVARATCAHSRIVRGRVKGRGIQNPHDEDLALLLAL